MNVQYSKNVEKVMADHRDEIWVERKLAVLQYEAKELKNVSERVSASHCPLVL